MTIFRKRNFGEKRKKVNQGMLRNWFRLVIPTIFKGILGNVRATYAEIKKQKPTDHLQAGLKRFNVRITNDLNSLRRPSRNNKTLQGRNQ